MYFHRGQGQALEHTPQGEIWQIAPVTSESEAKLDAAKVSNPCPLIVFNFIRELEFFKQHHHPLRGNHPQLP